MKAGVYGVWHQGSVTAACLADAGHQVLAIEPNVKHYSSLVEGHAPLHEPGLDALLKKGLDSGNLRVTQDLKQGLAGLPLLWIAFDTTLDEEDRADVAAVLTQVRACIGLVDPGTVILISAQMPLGSTLQLQAEAERSRPGAGIRLAYHPENLRLGQAIKTFQQAERMVLGVSDKLAQEKLAELFQPLGIPLVWMSVPSAEMTKHALNSFLALSVAFINQVALLCEKNGADAADVERALKTDARIGPRAYLKAGAAFFGGTLARDLRFLEEASLKAGLDPSLFSGILASNEAHKQWPLRKLAEIFGPSLLGRKVGILGMAYKSGTNSLRRSPALELCRGLVEKGALVQVLDPLVQALDEDLPWIRWAKDARELASHTEALVVFQSWPGLEGELLSGVSETGSLKAVLDPMGLLSGLQLPPGIRYLRVGL